MRISDRSSDVCSSDLLRPRARRAGQPAIGLRLALAGAAEAAPARSAPVSRRAAFEPATLPPCGKDTVRRPPMGAYRKSPEAIARLTPEQYRVTQESRSEEHTSELQSLMRISYAVFCLKKKTNTKTNTLNHPPK